MNNMIKALFKAFEVRWKSYRHRFVPWIALNLQKNERTLRQVENRAQDKMTADEDVFKSLVCLFTHLLKNDVKNQRQLLGLLPRSTQSKYSNVESKTHGAPPSTVMFETLGFSVERKISSLERAGTGVFVMRGRVPAGSIVAMYPGTIYQPDEPIFFQSVRNPFVFRCIDGILIDGNDKSISKIVYRSCSGRDRFGPLRLSDGSWLTPHPENPLAVGQYVNNCSNEKSANVCFQELDVPDGFPLELRQYLPNVNYRADSKRPLRCVVLVALRDIDDGEELFSNYYTIVH
ncbi:SET domain-containing protein 9 isoform X1 [Danio rerio]|uniref:SET domain-containing protein 9 isoform X1 n=1 Tax=Danio rerio TaxID=7955 RepID=A0A8M1PRU1_DANRE|nr:SET domain-containing protein 9 isoform X1 [Danio rerio]|eukprot:XP_001332805.2 SET domain-containing protein 9 isoform X1 [Danio rerio]